MLPVESDDGASDISEIEYRLMRLQQGSHSDHPVWEQVLDGDHSPNGRWLPDHDQALFSAVFDEDPELVDILLRQGAQMNEHNENGRTVLQEAVLLGNQEMVLLFLQYGVEIDSLILSGFLSGGTALHLAVIEGMEHLVTILLRSGAHVTARTQIGWSPLDIAVLDHQTTILEVFLSTFRSSTTIDLLSDVQFYVDQSGDDHNEQTAIASHLLEYGVRDTERKHVLFFQRCLLEAMKESDFSNTPTEDLSAELIRNTEKALLDKAGLVGTLTWPRNLCEACQVFEKHAGYNLFQIYYHTQDFSSLLSSSTDGCDLCCLLVDALQRRSNPLQEAGDKWETEFGVSPVVRLMVNWKNERVFTWLPDYELVVACDENIAFTDLDCVQKQLNSAVAETGPSDTQETVSDRTLAVAKAWLQRCEDGHMSCQRREAGKLPNRVIDVGSALEEPRVHVSHNERVPYAALSYCWGNDHNVGLLSTNIDTYTQSLSLVNLPKTLADAVIVARKMNVRYLWVDSLCILQDSEADLKKELSYMGQIYAGAWFTIAAKDSPSCTSGLFAQRDWPVSAILPTDIRLPSRLKIRDNGSRGPIKNTRTSCMNRLMALPYQPYFGNETPVLETRGWTLQEELLSRRILNCGEDEFSWVCLEATCTERSPAEDDVRGGRIAHNLAVKHQIRRVLVTGIHEYDDTGGIMDKAMFINYWFETVENFLRRSLSMPRDKLAAISGVQSEMAKVLDDDPVAGIWKGQYFASSLLWYVESRKETAKTGSFFCPSWSWASVPHAIRYHRYSLDTEREHPDVWYNKVEVFSEVMSSNVDDSDLFDISGYLTIRCKLLREATLDCERLDVDDLRSRSARSHEGKGVVQFLTTHDFESATRISDSWLMLVQTTQYIPSKQDRKSSNDDEMDRNLQDEISADLLRLERISPDQKDFRRIGLVTTNSCGGQWLQCATEETIRLF